MTGEPGTVGRITVLAKQPRKEEAEQLLKKIASLVKPIMKKHGWHLPTLAEFFPENPNLLGININRGQKICIRLRPAHSPDTFYDMEQHLMGTMLHELTHNHRGPHDEVFYAFLKKLEDEYYDLQSKGYTGEGFEGKGKRVGLNEGHDLPPHLARLKALEQAEKRRRLSQIMGPSGGQRLGGSKQTNKTPRQLAAEAADRRARDEKTCGLGHDPGVSEEHNRAAVQLADKMGEVILIDDDSDEQHQHPIPSTSVSKVDSDDDDIILIRGGNASTTGSQRQGKKRTLSETTAKQAKAKAVLKPSNSPGLPAASWICTQCTYENDKVMALQCDMCLSERTGSFAKQNKIEDGWTCHRCTTITSHDFWTCRSCGTVKLSSAKP